jgi:hypothetical protein
MEKCLFRTLIHIPKAEKLIETKHKILFIGSCFASNIGKFMDDARFHVMSNPFGVLYNPVSVAWSIESAIENADAGNLELVYNNELWHSLFHHGKFSRLSPEETIEEINCVTNKVNLFLKETDFLILTF